MTSDFLAYWNTEPNPRPPQERAYSKESYLGMGLVRRAQGNQESAKVMIEKALTIDPDFSLAQRWLQRL